MNRQSPAPRTHSRLLGALLAFFVLGAGGLPPFGPLTAQAATPRVRVASAGPWLETAAGERLFIFGVNYLGPPDQAWQMWESAKFDRRRIADDFGRMRAGGFNTARIVVAAPLAADVAAGRFDKLDYVLDQADAAGMRVVLTLADYAESRVETLAATADALARRYAGRATILAWDLKNEPQFFTFATAVYPGGTAPPLLDQALIERYGERHSRAASIAWRRDGEGRSLTPARFTDDEAHRWHNVLTYYRELLDEAADWAGDAAGRSSGDFLTTPEAERWRPFLAALDATIAGWLTPQVDAIRRADRAALVTVGYNTIILAVQPANARLQIQSFHRFPTPGAAQWRAVFTALDSLQRAFPRAPVVLEEFGYSNRTRAGSRVDEDQTAAHEIAIWLELARRGLAGGLKWMLYNFDQGANPYENAFGALRSDTSPKPVFQAMAALAGAGAWRVTSLDVTGNGADLLFVARGPGLLVAAGPQRLPELDQAIEAGGLVIARRPAGSTRLRLTATAPAELRLDTTRLLGAQPSQVRVETGGAVGRVEGGRFVLHLAAGAVVELRAPAMRPTGRATPLPGPATTVRFFPQTGHNLIQGFKYYWERNGGLAIFGYPLTEEFREVNPADGQTYTVQYFQRARFEYHPEHKGTAYETQLGLLGRQVTADRADEAPFRPLTGLTDRPERRFFAATGHTLYGGFRLSWERSGGLAQFGYPISEEFTERNPADGKEYTVQYFERARFEYHPEHKGTPYEVELGLLGWQIIESG